MAGDEPGRNDRVIKGPQSQLNARVSTVMFNAVRLLSKRTGYTIDAIGEVAYAGLLGYSEPELHLRRRKILAALAKSRQSGELNDRAELAVASLVRETAQELHRAGKKTPHAS